VGGGPDIALVLHPRRDPGAVLGALRLVTRLPDELRELAK